METISTAEAKLYDRQRLAGIYEQYSPGLFRYAYRLLGDQDQAEDCVSETFSRFLHVLLEGRQPENVQAYLYRVAHNWVTDQYRRKPRNESLDPEMHDGSQENPAHTAVANLDRERVRLALQDLPAEQRLVVVLRFLEDRTHEEAAAVLGKSIEATRALQYRALAALRRMLIEREDEDDKEE
ncbi:MAG: polymerase sigma-70 factor, subfamily [Chloroflexi bacterium]|nr:polymerase sigma-70 factor, subfamily [Chloroflexota bacterium]